MIFDSPIIREDMENIAKADFPLEKLAGSSVLITGATGMLASYVVYFLVYLNLYKGMNIDIYACSRSKEKAEARFKELPKDNHFRIIQSDLLNPIDEIEKCDYIIHAAGPANPRMYSTSPVEVIEPNAIGTYNLLKSALKWQSRNFLFFSSGDVYGEVDTPGEIYEDTLGRVDQIGEHSCYSEGKRFGETLCRAFWSEYGLSIVSARIGHSYGPTMDIETDPRVFASFLKSVVDGKDIVMHSTGEAKRPFCYISDAVAGFMILLLKGEPGEAYNLCNYHQFISIKELADIIVNLKPELGLKAIHKDRNKDDSYTENKVNVDNCPISSKLEEKGWKCTVGVKEGMGRTLAYLEGAR